uniref:Uncharacterized protein n=1 Tax=Lotharella globosa TaxID=91324 RepID=A0A7S3Z206_9EUKA|mmetsp:Transcript_36048/g.69625  ORF Transcript_36048/g.69625 Transcript_36048/m.69625 type:complete len:113 (+) Transcript_36048:515-853(+)
MSTLGGDAPDLGKGYEALKTSHPNIDYLGKCTLVAAHPAPPTSSPTHVSGATTTGPTSVRLFTVVGDDHVVVPTTLGYWVLLGGVMVIASIGGCVAFGARYRLGIVRKVHGI